MASGVPVMNEPSKDTQGGRALVYRNTHKIHQPLPLTSWTALLKALKDYDLHVIIENINKGYLDFWIGPIMRVSEKSVSSHNYDPDGRLDAKPTAILLEEHQRPKIWRPVLDYV